ncbi:ATP-binding cassette domain-containing protein [Streptomyces sp. SBT349]|uniref:ATP-binding cassette domain-containing protein n=1 Tax=Streptomyces sp. SBT349 TaxID=1580539 RepID=UPI00069FA987|nr:ATP-binding cassette domain-containing protein [Streptomyces sp. SBT349]
MLDLTWRASQRLVRILAGGVCLPERPFRDVLGERMRLLQIMGLAPWPLTALLLAGHIMTAVAPAALALATGVLVSAVTDARAAGSVDTTGMLVAAGFFALVSLGWELGNLLVSTVGPLANRQIDRRVRDRLRRMSLTPPGIAHLEEPAYQDDLRRASDLGISWRVRSPGTAATGYVLVLFRLVSALVAAVLLARFSLVLAAALVAAAGLMRAVARAQWVELQTREEALAGEKRKATYWMDLAASASAAKEVRLFGLGEWVTARRHTAELGWVRQVWQIRNAVYARQATTAVLAVISAGSALLVLGLATRNGTIGVDKLAMYMAASTAVLSFSKLDLEQFDMEHGVGAVRAFDRLAQRSGVAVAGGKPLPDTAAPPVIRFHDVSFRYPGADVPVLDGLNLEIRSGEVIAVVGINGAGKTTMMKLLAGLYAPSGGRLTVDGIDVAALDPAAWRQRLTMLFQDFIHYPLSAERNVSLGAGHRPVDPAAVRAALRDTGADEFVRELPLGGRTPVTRSRAGGIELSGGQWQRFALARILYAVRQGAQVVVLDEPTAHLDVRAEAAFFDEVVAAAAGATVALISHRLSTVRRADRILVLDGGTITQTGDHDTLITRGGEYARLFQRQAALFTDPAPPSTEVIR